MRFYENYGLCSSHRSMETPAYHTCALLKFLEHLLYLAKNCHGKAANELVMSADELITSFVSLSLQCVYAQTSHPNIKKSSIVILYRSSAHTAYPYIHLIHQTRGLCVLKATTQVPCAVSDMVRKKVRKKIRLPSSTQPHDDGHMTLRPHKG